MARRRYDATPEGIKELDAQLQEAEQKRAALDAQLEQAKKDSDDSLRARNPKASPGEQELYAQQSPEYRALLTQQLDAGVEASQLAQRKEEGEARFAFEKKALKFETERQERVSKMEELAEKGDMKGLQKAYKEYDKAGFNSPPVSLIAQVTKTPASNSHVDERTNALVTTETYTVSTANRGEVKVIVQMHPNEDGTSFNATIQTSILKPGVTSTRTKERKRRGPVIDIERVGITGRDSRPLVEAKVQKVGDFESKLYYRELMRECQDNQQKRTHR